MDTVKAACLVGILAMLGGLIETRIVCKDKTGKEKFLRWFFSTAVICLFSSFFIKFNLNISQYLHIDEIKAGKYIFAAIVTVIVAVVKILIAVFLNRHCVPCTEEELKKNLKPLNIICVILFSLGISLYMFGHFVQIQWSSITPEQMFVNIMTPTTGTEFSIYLRGFEHAFLAIGFSILFGVVCCRKVRLERQTKEKIKTMLSRTAKSVLCFVIALSLFVTSFFYINSSMSLSKIYKFLFMPSDFIEENYVDIRDIQITFPEQKRNLIYIYLESMENSYLSKELGGYMDENLMPELTELAYEGEVFSNSTRKFGGPMQVTGTEWSMASMVNQTLGIPMKAPKNFSAYKTPGHFLGGVYGLGDLLKDNGYTQTMMVGGNKIFGGKSYMYQTHGEFKLVDHTYALEHHMLPEGYKVWWGYEDDKLFAFAKDELNELSQSEKPFNLILATADTHMPDGYLSDDAPTPYESHYANAIAYNTRKLTEFIRWVQAQPFYENTTIIMIGDHHSMDSKFFADFDENYLRTTFNLILNPAESVKNTDASRFVNRTYANFDMLPTTLAALGCEIEGNKAGMGTNLYSDEKNDRR